MNCPKSSLILFLFFLSAAYCSGQEAKNVTIADPFRAIHWGLDEGISQGEVYSMIKDHNGFLWMGTAFGLNRFDGATFKKYFADRNKKNTTIIGNEIHGLIEDSLHNIWIGTNNGLSSYDVNVDSFRNFPSAVSGLSIIPFWATETEVFCMDYPASQISAFDIRSLKKRRLATISETDTVNFGISDQNAIYDPVSKSIWLVKGFRIWAGGGLLQISLKDGKRTAFTWPCYLNRAGHSHYSEGMRYDRNRHSIWINSPDGLVEFSLSDRKFHPIEIFNDLLKQKGFQQSAGIDLGTDGRIWLGAFPKGILIYNPKDNSVAIPFPNDSTEQNTVSYENVCIYCDKNGMIWTGSFSNKGIYQLIPFSPAVRHYMVASKTKAVSSNKVVEMLYAGQGKLWLGMEPYGIDILDAHNNTLEKLPIKDLALIKNKKYGYILPLKADTLRKKAWIASDGVFEMDLITKKCTPAFFENGNGDRIPLNGKLSNKPFNCVPWVYKNSCMVIASFADRQSLLMIDRADSVAKEILSFPSETIDRFSFFTDDDHLLFLKRDNAPTNLTFTNSSGKWLPMPNPFDSISWDRIYWNKHDQSYWIIAETQLLHYDKNFHLKRGYTQQNGLPGIRIFNLIADRRGNIWFNTDRSLHQLNTRAGTVMRLSDKDGFLPHDFSDSHFTMDDDGDIYFVSVDNGFYRINPDKFVSANSTVYLESLEINQRPFALPASANNVRQLSLRYFENKITIETGIIDYYSRGKSAIRYRLDIGQRKADWQYAPAYYTIRYEGLSPGDYRLVIQAANASNEFVGVEKQLLIHISPAFWNTWWFRIMTTLGLVGIIYLFMRMRLQQKFRLQLERSEKEKQMADLRQRTTEMEMQALRAQMNPHFIFNSLNSINRFILQNNKQQASEYLTKFSKLVRMILQNSQASLISLESELESLGLYLEMEALRFNYHFEYKISVPKDLDIEVLKIPPLILQPYVENAIWHGLMHKEEKGQLDIEVSEQGDCLFFRISDNGIGRKQAEALSSKSATKHKSMGLKITANRIAMIQHTGGDDSFVMINDLVDANGEAAGTEVIIKIPVKYD